MAEAVLALPPPYLWLERSLHLKPRKIDRTWTGLNLETTKSSATEGYCGWGRRSKARFLREKNPMRRRRRATVPAIPDWGKVPVGLDDRGSACPVKVEMRGLDSVPGAIHTRLPLESDFRATSPCLSQLVALQARLFEVDPCLIPRLSTDVDVPVESDGADRGRWRMGGAFCYDFGRLAGPVE